MLCQLFRSLEARESAFFIVMEPFYYAFCKAILFCFGVVGLFGILYDSFACCSGHDSHFSLRGYKDCERRQDYSALVVPHARWEDLANALVHRDYSRLGAVHVQWHEDRIEICNPGGFPEGVRLDNLLVTPPRARSPVLADAFKRAGIVERTARGIDAIFFEQLRNGRQAPFL